MNEPIVIIGGGFAGAYVARHVRRLLRQNQEIILFSRENHFVFTPLLADVLGSALNPFHVVRPIRQMADRVTCRTATVTHIDFQKQEITFETADTRQGTQRYGHLVLALGQSVKLDLVPGMAAHSWPFKGLGDAMLLRNHVIGRMERAEVEPDPEIRKHLLSFLVIGGGFTGVEVAGELWDLLMLSRRFYTRVKRDEISVTLIESKDRIMAQLPASLSEFALKKLQKRGIRFCLNAMVQAVTERGVRLKSGEEIQTGTVICTIGNTSHPLIRNAGLPMVRDRVKTAPDMRLEGFSNVWALGDCAAVPNARSNGDPCPATAQFAVRQARHLARNLVRVLHHKPTEPFGFKVLGELASIGHRNAVGEIFGVKVSGFLGWFLWRGVYLSKMPTFARQVQIAFDWAWELFFPRDLVQVNVEPSERIGREHFEPGQVVFRKGDFGDKFYMIERGHAGRYLEDEPRPVAVLGPGEHFGELALLEAGRRATTIKAEEALDVLTMDRHAFARLTQNLGVLRSELVQSAQRIKASQELMERLKDHPKLTGPTVAQVMSRPVLTMPADTRLCDAVKQIRKEHKGAYPILEGERAVGIVTRTDFYRALLSFCEPETRITSLMSKPLLTVRDSAPLSEAVREFIRHPVKHLVVVSEDGSPVGMLTPFDVLEFLVG